MDAPLEAGMAKLFASEMCQEVTLEALRIHGGFGYTKEFNIHSTSMPTITRAHDEARQRAWEEKLAASGKSRIQEQ